MVFIHFTSQIIMLAVGFGVGYGLLVVASRQKDALKKTGKVLGWVLIVASIFLAIMNCYFSMQFAKEIDHCPCPHCRMIHNNHNEGSMMDMGKDDRDFDMDNEEMNPTRPQTQLGQPDDQPIPKKPKFGPVSPTAETD